MEILVIAEKKANALPFVGALKERHAHAKYLRISKIALVSKKGETLIKSLGKELPPYDAIFIHARPSLAQFIEPLLEELTNKEIYCTAKKGSYYTALNEPFQFVTLATEGVPTPKTLTSGSAKNIEKISKKISYPLMAKSFISKKTQQALIVNNSKELNTFVKSIRTEIDGLMLREYIEADAISCIVIGKKVFAVKRKNINDTIQELSEGETYKPTEHEEEVAIHAALACGLEIARVDLVKGRVVKIDTILPLTQFNIICSENIEEHVANFLIDKAALYEGKRIVPFDLISILKKFLSKTIFGRFFN